jgi:ABC-type phosphate/phosphonate transport system substrate-binding protein
MRRNNHIAGLPMYDLPALRPATDAFWAAIRRSLLAAGIAEVPAGLSRDLDPETLWTHPNLLLAQACGLPLVTLLDGRVRFVATPIYAVAGCSDGDYRSWLVVREGDPVASPADLEGSIAAVNTAHSQSGANALAILTTPCAAGRPFFGDIRLTGAHTASLDAVRTGKADCAAIDCVTWHHLARTEPEATSGLRILAASPPVPALPFITSISTDDATRARLRAALQAAIDTAGPETASLAITGLAANDATAYARIRAMHEESLKSGCARLATLLADLAPRP